MTDKNPSSMESNKPFGLWSATFLVVANMIGAGVFTTSGFSFADLGDRQYVMLAWLIGSGIAICGAISYGQLAQRITESGGEYLFLSRLVHPAAGFIAGWVSLLAGFTGAIAFAATAFESYAVPDAIRPGWLQPGTVGIATILLFGILHSATLKTGVLTQNIVVGLKLALLAGFVGFAFFQYPSGWQGMQIQTEDAEFSIYAIASTLVWISLSFSGFNAAVYVTGEVDNPKTNVPRALLLGTLITTAFYLLLNFVFLYAAPPEQIRNVQDIAAVASQSLGGNSLATLIRVIVSVALLSSVSSMIIAGPRVYAKMADDGVFPKLFNTPTNRLQNVPATAIWLQVICAVTVVYFSTLVSLLDYLSFTLSVSAAITVACLLWTRRDNDTVAKRFIYCSIAALYIAATFTLAILSTVDKPEKLTAFALTIVSGLALYFLVNKKTKTSAG